MSFATLPTLETPRLILRPFVLQDAADVQRLAGDPQVAATTANIPHPYPDEAAAAWIRQHPTWFAERRGLALAVTRKQGGELLGTSSLMEWHDDHARAELGYWIGAPYWRRGYCTEAVAEVVRYAKQELKLTRIVGRCLSHNIASERVMLRAGLLPEGKLLKHVNKNGRFEDVSLFGTNDARRA